MRDKLNEIMYARGISILGVLAIHVTAAATVDLPVDNKMYFFYLIVNKIASFSVPAFIFFSGLVLFYQYPHFRDYKDIFNFYSKRIKYLVLPYIFWSLFYFITNGLLNKDLHPFSINEYLKMLLTGKAEYHLYFIPLIAQYYLMFPLIVHLFNQIKIRKPKWLLPCILGLSIMVQILMGIIVSEFHIVSDKSILSSTYLLSFTLGGYIGYYFDQSCIWILNRKKNLFIVTIIFLILHITDVILATYQWPIFSFIREGIVQCYCILTSICLLILGSRVRRKLSSSGNLLLILGAHSFGIYIVHPIFLTLYRYYFDFPVESPLYQLNIFIKAIIVIVLPAVFVKIVKKFKCCYQPH